jgi:hypothetical protein
LILACFVASECFLGNQFLKFKKPKTARLFVHRANRDCVSRAHSPLGRRRRTVVAHSRPPGASLPALPIDGKTTLRVLSEKEE